MPLSPTAAARLALAGALLIVVASGCGDGGPSGDPARDAGSALPPCDYPAFTGSLAVGQVLPTFGWREALRPDESTFDFTAEVFHCAPEFDRYTSMILVVSAGWCSSCPGYIAMMNDRAAGLEAAGALVVYVEVETSNFQPASSRDAADFIEDAISPDTFEGGLRIGDLQNLGEELLRPKMRSFPSAYFVRRRDMVIVASQGETIYTLDWDALAADPEQRWTPTLPPFEGHCGPGDEEATEPNDAFAQATLIEPGTERAGGVCAEGSDFYQVNVAGPWRFDLYQDLFMTPDPDRYDANLRLWGPDMARLGGSNVRGNHDWVDWMGPAFVEVYGEQNASGTYRVSVTAR